MRWLHDHGLCNGFAEYEGMPIGVLEDARLLMVAEGWQQMIADRGMSRG